MQSHLRNAIAERPAPIQIISMCAGEGRDVIGVLAKHPRRTDVTARLVELEPRNAAFARAAARVAHLDNIEVVEADAGSTDPYVGGVPAEIVLACGIFGNVPDQDVLRTIEYLPCLCAPGATVMWTGGCERDRDFAITIRGWFSQNGFDDVAYEADETGFRVGVARLASTPQAFEPGVRLFTFFR